MDNTLQNALKELFYSLGGNAADVANVTDVNALIAAISALGLGAKIEEGGGGSDILVASATLEADPTSETYGDPGEEITLDKDYDEIAAADNSVVHLVYDDTTYILQPVKHDTSDGEFYFTAVTEDHYLLSAVVYDEGAMLKSMALSTEVI